MFELNKRYTLDAPQGTISEHGVELIKSFIAAQRLQDENWKTKNSDTPKTYLSPLPDDWTWQWVVKGRGEYVGTFPKRVSKFYFQHDNLKVPNDFLQQIGNLAREHSEANTVYHFEIVNKLDWQSGAFGDSGSCFWTSRNNARAIMQDNGGKALCFYDETDKGYARAWVATVENGVYIVFNGYGFKSNPTLVIARVLAQFLGLSYKKIPLSNNGYNTSTIWINSSIGYIVGGADKVAAFSQYDLHWNTDNTADGDEDDEDTIHCDNCGDEIDEDEIYTAPNDDTYCRDCFYENCSYCDNCDNVHWRDDMYYIENEDRDVCEWCYGHNYIRCDGCEGDIRNYQMTTVGHYFYCEDCLPEHTTHCVSCHQTMYQCRCQHH